jgi:tetratricopeptide (TPR) repeat protein
MGVQGGSAKDLASQHSGFNAPPSFVLAGVRQQQEKLTPMKLITSTAIALVAALAAAPAVAQTSQNYGAQAAQPAHISEPAQNQQTPTKGPKASATATKALIDLQDTVKKNDFANVPAKVAAAQAVASTKDDRYLIGKFQLDAARASNDNAMLATAIDNIAASGYLDTTKVAGLYQDLGGILFTAKQYPQAAAAYKRALSIDAGNAEAARMLGIILFQQGQKAEAAATLRKFIQTTTAAGQKPTEDTYRIAVQSASDANLPAANDLARQWYAAYPSADSWRLSIAVYRNSNLNRLDNEATIDLLRLMQASGALTTALDYELFAATAFDQSNYNEAQAVMDAGLAAKVLDPANSQVRDIMTALKSKTKATVADLETAEKTAQNAGAYLKIGDRYYAMGQYAKAAEVYRKAIGKSGVDQNVANLHLGMALARAGDKAGAAAAFNAVTGPRADIAKFWLAYVNQRA